MEATQKIFTERAGSHECRMQESWTVSQAENSLKTESLGKVGVGKDKFLNERSGSESVKLISMTLEPALNV